MERISNKKRWNPWPICIICFFAFAIAGAVAFIVFCNFHPSDLVTGDYYEQELRFQGQMERMQRANELPQSATIDYDAGRKILTLVVPRIQPQQGPTTGEIHFYRPSAAGLDRRLALQLNSEGKQEICVETLQPGLWQVKLLWTAGGKEYFVGRKLVIPSAS